MRNFSFSLFNIVFGFSIILLVVLILIPFNLINLEQAQRIAKWKAEYERLKYSFELVNLHEGSIIPSVSEEKEIISEEYVWNRILPYFKFGDEKLKKIKKYKYRKMNGLPIKNGYKHYFENFIETKSGMLFSIKQNHVEITDEKIPLYFAFIDINGIEKPNRIGQDIFLMEIYKHNVNAFGKGKNYARLKADCSPIGKGVYCGEYYLLGGSF